MATRANNTGPVVPASRKLRDGETKKRVKHGRDAKKKLAKKAQKKGVGGEQMAVYKRRGFAGTKPFQWRVRAPLNT